MTSISAIRTLDVLRLAEDAQRAGASAVLLAPISYLSTNEWRSIFTLWTGNKLTLHPTLCLWQSRDLPFSFQWWINGRIAELPHVRSIKIPGVPNDPEAAKTRIKKLREFIPPHVTIGVSGDSFAVTGLNAGCEAWYSVLSGLFPKTCLKMTRLAQAGLADEAEQPSTLLQPIWSLFHQYGSLRVVSAAAEINGLISSPLQPLNPSAREHLQLILKDIQEMHLNSALSPEGAGLT